MHSPAYCTLADLQALPVSETELLQLTDPDNTGAIDAVMVAHAAETAASEIDTYLAARVTVPLASVPATVVRLAAILTRYYLHHSQPTELVQTQYDRAVSLLGRLADGKASLGIEPEATAGADSEADLAGGGVLWETGAHVWTRNSTTGGLA